MRLFLVLEVVFGLCMDPKPFGIQERENKGTNVVQSIFRLYSSNLFSGYTGLICNILTYQSLNKYIRYNLVHDALMPIGHINNVHFTYYL